MDLSVVTEIALQKLLLLKSQRRCAVEGLSSATNWGRLCEEITCQFCQESFQHIVLFSQAKGHPSWQWVCTTQALYTYSYLSLWNLCSSGLVLFLYKEIFCFPTLAMWEACMLMCSFIPSIHHGELQTLQFLEGSRHMVSSNVISTAVNRHCWTKVLSIKSNLKVTLKGIMHALI